MTTNVPEGLLHQPKNTMPRIAELWAFLSVDPTDGNEGVIATRMGETWITLVAADRARLESFWPLVKNLRDEFGVKMRLVKFTARIDVEDI
jgi:hypothetical protein